MKKSNRILIVGFAVLAGLILLGVFIKSGAPGVSYGGFNEAERAAARALPTCQAGRSKLTELEAAAAQRAANERMEQSKQLRLLTLVACVAVVLLVVVILVYKRRKKNNSLTDQTNPERRGKGVNEEGRDVSNELPVQSDDGWRPNHAAERSSSSSSSSHGGPAIDRSSGRPAVPQGWTLGEARFVDRKFLPGNSPAERLTFRLTMFDSRGEMVQEIPIEMTGAAGGINGQLKNGDQVAVPHNAGKIDKALNVSTGQYISVKEESPGASLILLPMRIVVFLMVVGIPLIFIAIIIMVIAHLK